MIFIVVENVVGRVSLVVAVAAASASYLRLYIILITGTACIHKLVHIIMPINHTSIGAHTHTPNMICLFKYHCVPNLTHDSVLYSETFNYTFFRIANLRTKCEFGRWVSLVCIVIIRVCDGTCMRGCDGIVCMCVRARYILVTNCENLFWTYFNLYTVEFIQCDVIKSDKG